MPRPTPRVLIKKATDYLRAHPDEIVRTLRGFLGLRIGVPLDALRYLAEEFLQGKKAPKDVVIKTEPPGLWLAATVRAMGATLRAQLVLFVEALAINADEVLITLRIADLALEVLDGMDTPVAGLIKSGALDLSKPGNLVAYMPKRPEMLVEAKDDCLVVDVLKLRKLADNRRARRALAMVVPVLTVGAIKTRDDHLDVHFRVRPSGVRSALAAAWPPAS